MSDADSFVADAIAGFQDPAGAPAGAPSPPGPSAITPEAQRREEFRQVPLLDVGAWIARAMGVASDEEGHMVLDVFKGLSVDNIELCSQVKVNNMTWFIESTFQAGSKECIFWKHLKIRAFVDCCRHLACFRDFRGDRSLLTVQEELEMRNGPAQTQASQASTSGLNMTQAELERKIQEQAMLLIAQQASTAAAKTQNGTATPPTCAPATSPQPSTAATTSRRR